MKHYLIHLFLFTLILTTGEMLTAQQSSRSGFALEAGVGGGYSDIRPLSQPTGYYSIYGVNISGGIGFYLSGRSRITFGFQSNIFADEVADLWSDWGDKMSSGGFKAVGAIFLAPIIYTVAPIFLSHSLIGMAKYTWFSSDESPSFYLSGAVGPALVYERASSQFLGGFGLSGGTGYEFTNGIALGADLMYTSTCSEKLHALTLLVGLRFFLH